MKVLYPEDEKENLKDFLTRSRLRAFGGAILMGYVKTMSKDYVDLLVIPEWAINKKSEIVDTNVLEMKRLAERRGVKVVSREWIDT